MSVIFICTVRQTFNSEIKRYDSNTLVLFSTLTSILYRYVLQMSAYELKSLASVDSGRSLFSSHYWWSLSHSANDNDDDDDGDGDCAII